MSIILLIDGSPETVTAAGFAISIARVLKQELVAQVVIDSESVLKLTGFHGRAGLCGSGVFLNAYEEIIGSLTSIAESLLMSLTARAEGCGVAVRSSIDIGNGLTILANSIAQQESVLVAGGNDSNRDLLMSHEFQCPTFIVNGQAGDSAEVILLTGDERSNELVRILSRECPGIPVKLFNTLTGKAA